jgi:hypothetical protein
MERQRELDIEREWARAIAAGEKNMSEKIIWQRQQANDALVEEQRIQEMFRGLRLFVTLSNPNPNHVYLAIQVSDRNNREPWCFVPF